METKRLACGRSWQGTFPLPLFPILLLSSGEMMRPGSSLKDWGSPLGPESGPVLPSQKDGSGGFVGFMKPGPMSDPRRNMALACLTAVRVRNLSIL